MASIVVILIEGWTISSSKSILSLPPLSAIVGSRAAGIVSLVKGACRSKTTIVVARINTRDWFIISYFSIMRNWSYRCNWSNRISTSIVNVGTDWSRLVVLIELCFSLLPSITVIVSKASMVVILLACEATRVCCSIVDVCAEWSRVVVLVELFSLASGIKLWCLWCVDWKYVSLVGICSNEPKDRVKAEILDYDFALNYFCWVIL